MEHLDILQSQEESFCTFHIIHLEETAKRISPGIAAYRKISSHRILLIFLILHSCLFYLFNVFFSLCPPPCDCGLVFSRSWIFAPTDRSRAICKTNEDSLLCSSFPLPLLHLHSMSYLLSQSTVFCHLQCSISAFFHHFLSVE